MRDEWLLMEKISGLLFKVEKIPNEKRVDFYLIQECLKILERAEESHRFRLKSTSQLHQQ